LHYIIVIMASPVEEIKKRVNVVDLVGSYLRLSKAGANFKALCPFHSEKTPSFYVSPAREIWHCFGCDAGGDIFRFVSQIEGVEFPEALELLASRAGVVLRKEDPRLLTQRKRSLTLLEEATRYYQSELSKNKEALDYLKNRGLREDTVQSFRLGFAPDGWENVLNHLKAKDFQREEAERAGLAIRSEKASFYDRFRSRIMFPIWDVHGNVVGFTGRILIEKENSGGKYVNTPQTLVYDKSRVLYGLNKAKQEIKSKDLAVLVEGQMDVIACHQAGMKNVVAISGTALTVEQAKLLKRYSQNIAMAFDADSAGQNAAKRGIGVALEEGLNTKVIQIPPGAGKDADECLKKNRVVWFKAVEESIGFMDWYFTLILSDVNLLDARQKQQVAEILLSEINHLPYAVEREHWLKILADKLNIDSGALREESLRISSKEKIISSRHVKQEVSQASVSIVNNRQYLLLENLWALFFKFPKLLSSHLPELKRDVFVNSPFLILYEIAQSQYNIDSKIDFNLILQSMDKDEQERVNILALKADKDYENFSEENASKEIDIILNEIKREWTKNRRTELTNILRNAQATGDKTLAENVLKEIMELN